jgi:predicted MFS family arabinose efflux permease
MRLPRFSWIFPRIMSQSEALAAAPSAPVVALKNENLFLLTLAGMQFTHILDFMIMMPLGPQLVRLLHLSTHEFGLLLSSYTFTAAVSGLLASTYVDRFDRRKLILTLYVLFILATLCCGLSDHFSTLLISRALAGAFGGILGSVVQTMVADVIPYERRGRAMGTIMTAFSLSTVAGVPLGLFFSTHIPSLAWRAPFFFIVVVACILLACAYRNLPSLTAHLQQKRDINPFRQMLEVAVQPNHVRAFALISLIMLSSFTIIPYIPLYMTSNVGIAEEHISLIYLCGGLATMFSARAIGKLADRYGKHKVFRWIAGLALIPLLITTHLVPVPLWLVLINSTCFFVLVSGRIIPGMAMITASALPRIRGTFMSLVSSVQMMSSGLASLVSGLIIHKTDGGQIEHYGTVGYIALICTFAAIWLCGRVRTAEAD